MIATAAKSALDEPHRWADQSTWRRPSFDVEGFQSKINEIVGLSQRFDPIVKLRWMRDSECYEKKNTSWDSENKVITFDLRARYKFLTIDNLPDQPGLIIDIPPPRWVLEQRYEPEQIREAWEKERWEMIDGMPRPVKDSCPSEGYYAHLWTIAGHDGCCEDGVTEGADGAPQVCWGQYRAPSEKDLTTLKAMMWRRAQDDVITNPFEAPSEAMESKVVKRQHESDRIVQEKKDELSKDIMGDAIRQNLHKFTDDPSVLKHGKYHFTKGDKTGDTTKGDTK